MEEVEGVRASRSTSRTTSRSTSRSASTRRGGGGEEGRRRKRNLRTQTRGSGIKGTVQYCTEISALSDAVTKRGNATAERGNESSQRGNGKIPGFRA